MADGGPGSMKQHRTILMLFVAGPLLVCGGIYACSVPPRRATEAFLSDIRNGKPAPYALDSTDPADATRSLEQLKTSTGVYSFSASTRSTGSYTRSCLWFYVSLPGGGRFIDVALEEVRDEWKVRDVSFKRSCSTTKRGDYRLH